jgi:CDP-glucose 4,6-dehydratase
VEVLVMRSAFWAGKRVLVTGHTGFKGSWLALWLASLGARVTGFALPPATDPSLWPLLGLSGEVTDLTADVRDLAAVDAAYAEARPEIVFHLAAQSLVRPSYQDPAGTFATNVIGTAHVLDAARRCPATRAIVIVTSDKCYANRETDRAYREDDALGGRDPYSGSKACAEVMTMAYRNAFPGSEIGVASARAGNVIGGGDWAADRLLPDLVRSARQGMPAPIRFPKAVRPWQHVLEPLNGYLMLAERLWLEAANFASAWNFGPDQDAAAPVEDVANAVVSQWGSPARWVATAGEQPHEAQLLRLDSGKARSALGWKPRLALRDAVAWTVQWYRDQADGKDARTLCLQQIGRYMKLAGG